MFQSLIPTMIDANLTTVLLLREEYKIHDIFLRKMIQYVRQSFKYYSWLFMK